MFRKFLCWLLIFQHIYVYGLRAEITEGYTLRDQIYLHASPRKNGSIRLTLGTNRDDDEASQTLLDVIDIPAYHPTDPYSEPDGLDFSFTQKPSFWERVGVKRLPDRVHFVLQGFNISINNAGELVVEGQQTDTNKTIFLSSDNVITLHNLEAYELQITAPSFRHTGTSSLTRLILEGIEDESAQGAASFSNTGRLSVQDCFLRNLKGKNEGTLEAVRLSLMGDLESQGTLASDQLILEEKGVLTFTEGAQTNIRSLFLSPGCRLENYKGTSPLDIESLDGLGGTLINNGPLVVHEVAPATVFEGLSNRGLCHIEKGDLTVTRLENSETFLLNHGTLFVDEGHNTGGLQAPSVSVGSLLTNIHEVRTQHLKGTGLFDNKGHLESTFEERESDLTLSIRRFVNQGTTKARSVLETNQVEECINTQDAQIQASQTLTFSPTTRVLNEGLLEAREMTIEGDMTTQKGRLLAKVLHLTGNRFTNQEDGHMEVETLIPEGLRDMINKGELAVSTFVQGSLQSLENKGTALFEKGALLLRNLRLTNEGVLKTKSCDLTDGTLIQSGTLTAESLTLNGATTIHTTDTQTMKIGGELASSTKIPWDMRGTIAASKVTHLGPLNLLGSLRVRDHAHSRGPLTVGSQGILQGYPDSRLSLHLEGATDITGLVDVDSLEASQEVTVRPQGTLLSRMSATLHANLTLMPQAEATLHGLRVKAQETGVPLIRNHGTLTLCNIDKGTERIHLHNYGIASLDNTLPTVLAPALYGRTRELAGVPLSLTNYPQAHLILERGHFHTGSRVDFANKGILTLVNSVLTFCPGTFLGDLRVNGNLTLDTEEDALEALKDLKNVRAHKVIVRAPCVYNTATLPDCSWKDRPIQEYPWPLKLKLRTFFDNGMNLRAPSLSIKVPGKLKTTGYLFSSQDVLKLHTGQTLKISAPVSGLKGVRAHFRRLKIAGRKSIPGASAPSLLYERNNNGLYSTEGPLWLIGEDIESDLGTLSGTFYEIRTASFLNRGGLLMALDPYASSLIKAAHLQNIRADQGAYSYPLNTPYGQYWKRGRLKCNHHHGCPGPCYRTDTCHGNFETSPEGVIGTQGPLHLEYETLDMLASRISSGGPLTFQAGGQRFMTRTPGKVPLERLPGRTTMMPRNGHDNHIFVKSDLRAELGVGEITSSFTAAAISLRAAQLALGQIHGQPHQPSQLIDLLAQARRSPFSHPTGGTLDLLLPAHKRPLPSTLTVLGPTPSQHIPPTIDIQATMRLYEHMLGSQLFTVYRGIRALGLNMEALIGKANDYVRDHKNTRSYRRLIGPSGQEQISEVLVNSELTPEDFLHAGVTGVFLAFSDHLNALTSQVQAEQDMAHARERARLMLALPGESYKDIEATEGNLHITTDHDFTIAPSLKAKADVRLVSQQGAGTLGSTVTRTAVGENFTDHVTRQTIEGGQRIVVQTWKDLTLHALDTHSTQGTLFESRQGAVRDKALYATSQEVTHHHTLHESLTTTTAVIHPHVSHHRSEGPVVFKSDRLVSQEGTEIENGQIIAPIIDQQDVHEERIVKQEHLIHKRRNGFLGWIGGQTRKTITSHRATAQSKGCKTSGKQFVALAASLYTAVNPHYAAARNELAAPQVALKAGINESHAMTHAFSKDRFWNRMRLHQEDHTTYSNPRFEGHVLIHSPHATIEHLRGSEPPACVHSDTPLRLWDVMDTHHVVTRTQKTLTPEFATLVSVAAAAAIALTGGIGASVLGPLGAAMVGAAVSTAGSQVALGLLQDGNLKSLGSRQFLQGLGAAVVTAGATQGLTPLMGPIADKAALAARRTAVQAGVSTALRAATTKEDLGRTVLQGLATGGASAVAAYGAQAIGDLAVQGKISALSRTFLHGALGFGLGAASDLKDPLRGGAGGAIGAVAGEMIAPTLPQDWNKDVRIGLAALTGAAVAFATGQDPIAASLTATNAAENNCYLHEPSQAKTLAMETSEEDFVAQGLDRYEADHGVLWQPERAAMAGRLQRYYYTLRQTHMAQSMAAPGYERMEQLGGLPFEDFRALMLENMGPQAQATPRARFQANQIIRNQYEHLRHQSLDAMFAPALMALGASGAARTIRGFEVGRAPAQEQVVPQRQLLPGEGRVGTYAELFRLRVKGDNLTPNHVPQSAYLRQYGIAHGEGISIMMEHPFPGTGGRHRLTRTYGRQPDFSVAPRDELARDIWDIRQIYREDGLYTYEIRQALQEVIRRTKELRPDLFLKANP